MIARALHLRIPIFKRRIGEKGLAVLAHELQHLALIFEIDLSSIRLGLLRRGFSPESSSRRADKRRAAGRNRSRIIWIIAADGADFALLRDVLQCLIGVRRIYGGEPAFYDRVFWVGAGIKQVKIGLARAKGGVGLPRLKGDFLSASLRQLRIGERRQRRDDVRRGLGLHLRRYRPVCIGH